MRLRFKSSGKGEESYPDLLALLIAMLVTVIVGLGVKNSVSFNNVLNVVNLIVWIFMVIAGLFFLSGANWEEGRFLPYGWSGVRRFNKYDVNTKHLYFICLQYYKNIFILYAVRHVFVSNFL